MANSLGILNLFLALLLPWAAGWVAVRGLLPVFGPRSVSVATELGYAFLLGQVFVGLSLVILDQFGLGVGFHSGALMLGGFALLGGMILRFTAGRAEPSAGTPTPAAPIVSWQAIGSARFWLVLLLLTLILAHLIPSIIEVLWRPLYPWDAWTTWGYRARIWSEQQALVPFVAPDQWLKASESGAYTIDAHAYPSLVSLLQTWMALAWGEWSDTLINLPWLLVPVALGLLLYGELRALGLAAWVALAPAYLLVSIPLVHVHVSLAGYADLWQAAYVGAGFLSLLGGWLRRQSLWPLWGLMFLAMGSWVKQEGAVWLLIGVFLWILLLLGRWGIAALIGIGVAAGALVYTGAEFSTVLPYLGKVGVEGDVLYVPFIGSQSLVYNDIWRPLALNLFQYESWNLFWYIFPLALAVAFLRWRSAAPRVGGLALLLPFGTVVSVFLFTAHGQWAENYTAINRLFIHFMPLWLFSFVLIFANPAAERQ